MSRAKEHPPACKLAAGPQRFLLHTEGRGILQDYLWVGFLRVPEAFSRRSLQSQMMGELISPHLSMFQVKYLKSNPNLLMVQVKTLTVTCMKACEHVTQGNTEAKKGYTPTCSA